MARLRVQAIQRSILEKREDDCMNVWHFQTVGTRYEEFPDEQVLYYENVANRLGQFYSDWRDFSADNFRDVIDFRFFDLADPTPRAPRYETGYNIGPKPSVEALPHELAIVMSLRSAQVSGVPVGRRRGRLYLGPFNQNANMQGFIDQPCLNAIAAAADTLMTGLRGAVLGPVTWEIYSPTDDTMREVVHIHIDDAWDVQRRRGQDSRSTTVVDLSD